MNKYKLLRLFLSLKKSTEKGLSLIELIVALVMSGIVLTMAASGFVNVLRANQDVESKSVRNTGLQKALAFLQEELKQATEAMAVTKVSSDPNYDPNCTSAVDSQECLRLTIGERKIYYAYKNISSDPNVFLKPGILQRQAYNKDDEALDSEYQVLSNQDDAWEQQYTTIADGLIIDQPEGFDPTTFCSQGGITWGDTNVYGDDSSGNGGFRFCLEPNEPDPPRLVRVFLHGRTVDDKKINGQRNSESGVNTIGFARGESRLIISTDPTPHNNGSSVDVTASWTRVNGVTYDAKYCTGTNSCTPSTNSFTNGVALENINLSSNNNICFSLTATYNSTTYPPQIKCVK